MIAIAPCGEGEGALLQEEGTAANTRKSNIQQDTRQVAIQHNTEEHHFPSLWLITTKARTLCPGFLNCGMPGRTHLLGNRASVGPKHPISLRSHRGSPLVGIL